MITIYPSASKPKEPRHISTETAVERIKSGRAKESIDKWRNEPDSKEKKLLKATKIPAYSWSGTFSEHKDAALLKHSGLVCIDFDHLNGRLDEFKKRVCSDKYTHVAFVSPSGEGLKVVIKIPDNIKTHALSCKAIKNYFNDESLDEFEDVGRLCFDSHDPEIYHNPNSERFDDIYEEKKEVRIIKTVNVESDFDKVYEGLKKWKEKSDAYTDGNKHKFLVSLSAACNRFGVPQETTVNKLTFDYINKASQVDQKDFESIVKRVYTNYRHQYATNYFDRADVAFVNDGTKATENIFDASLPAKDIIYAHSLEDKLVSGFYNGYERGTTTYFKTIDPHFTWLVGDLMLMGGIMNHGKSTMMMQLALIKSVKEGVKWGIFSPEQQPPTYFYNDLIHTYIGKNVDVFYNNQMSFAEYRRGLDFVKEHFYYVFPDTDIPTPEYINDRFGELIVKHNICGCITDPFNTLDHHWTTKDKTGRDDRYLSTFLGHEKSFAMKNNLHKIIVAHPNASIKKKSDGNYDCPDTFDFAGGAMWGNKCDIIAQTYRPYYTTDKQNTETKFITQKIKKQKIVGIPDEVTLTFDRNSNRYLENGKSPFMSEDERQAVIPYEQQRITPNLKADEDDDKYTPF